MGKFVDRTGERIGRLTVLERANDYIDKFGIHRIMWKCVCDCGNIVVVRTDSLSLGHTTSCGCVQKERAAEALRQIAINNTKHGDSDSRIYNIWYLMRYRCNNPKCIAYHNYGGRGISVCNEWDDIDTGYINFKEWALSNGYSHDLTIDRIDNNGNYEPLNCRWVDLVTQNNNKRNNTFCTMFDKTYTISQWAKIKGIPMKTLHRRIELGWSVEEALLKPVRKLNHINKIDG